MIVRCKYCNYKWNYKGRHPYWATCPKCLKKIRVRYPPLKKFPLITSEKDIIYISGFFDGEGCISILKQKRKDMKMPHYFLEIKITNTNKDVIQYIYNVLKVGRLSKKADKRKNHRTQWCWIANSTEAVYILKLLLPYLKVKKEQAKLAIEFQEKLNRRKHSLTVNEVKEKEKIRRKIMKLNKGKELVR